ncbi:myo-inositol transporter 1-like isoform X3 [Daphnia pulicaria]|uniref:myo-inositol transporter 1-like isoform X3 n=1 Tax=Daphnia pulicaria TaxID=35523 RepID=UPI001EEA1FB3|nr:myo-inositol transporter 1-like isoform X3 [Daphnia pulicaria]
MRRCRDSDSDSPPSASSHHIASPNAASAAAAAATVAATAAAAAARSGNLAPVLTASRTGTAGAGAAWYATDTVQLTTFRPLASAVNKPVTCAGANTISGGGTPKPKSRTLDSSDTSDYENLSSCTSGRYATLPPQPQFGEGAKGNNGQYRDHYSTATTASAGVLFRPAGGAVGSFADNANEQFPSGDPPHTLSLHRPIKRSHWLNHNGRQSDVLARVFQANQDWLESNDGQDTVATTTSSAGNITIKDARSSHRTSQHAGDGGRSLPPPGGVFQLPPVMGTLQRFDQGSGEMRQLTGSVLAPNSSGSSLLMNAPLGGVSTSLLLPQQQQQQQQQLLPLMSFGPPFLMQPTAPSAMPLPASVSNSLAHLQQQHHHHQQHQQQQQQVQLQQRDGNHTNHGGHTHAIQLQTSLEMAPVVCPALCEIRTQLQELTRSVESCQNEVSDMKRDMSTMRHDVESVHHVKEDIDDLRDCIDKLQEQNRRRKLRLLEQGLTGFLIYAIFAAVLGMLQFGYNTGVINAPQGVIESFIKSAYYSRYGVEIADGWEKIIFSIAVSIFAIGGMIGGFGGGFVANKFGRKRGLLLNNATGILGAILMAFSKAAQSYEMLIIGRMIIGFNCGLNTSLVPMYISEIAPLNLRGGLGTVNQLGVTVGILFSQILGIQEILGTESGWPLLLGLAICPAILQLILFSFCPESPRYLLITANREEEARTAMKRLRASSQIEEDMEEMRVEAQQSEAHMGMLELLKSRALLMPLGIAIVMQLSQQLSGINAVLYYSTELFIGAGLASESAKYATIGVGAIMVGMTLVSIPLMDRAGRRTLHLWGLGGMFIFSIFITISLLVMELIEWVRYVAVVATLTFVLFFAVGPGSIPWMITAELFSQGPRPAAMSIAVLVNWLANFLVGLFFLPLKAMLHNYIFLPFSVLLAFFWIFTYKIVPETKNKTFDEISALFRRNDRVHPNVDCAPSASDDKQQSSL